ncbi:hypothetical protein EV694_1431 [Volucribacter psittacicida]|uniref:NAD(P)-binding domain-containing protein n=1 Tax=Volucribacter psittacicida TaxID=203482 RepID=A0A4R1FVI5_9PAST|nr:NAD(P)H-binding protein [Volucribacter psittacicida]TCJ97842.1 hypothetical protein EV694_1431 [Volucribacter psittacicida]
MKVLLIGGTGYTGKAVCEELLQRGHQVILVTRQPEKIQTTEQLQAISLPLTDIASLTQQFAEVDVVVNAAVPDRHCSDFVEQVWQIERALVEAAKMTKVRLFLLGGAGSLYVAPQVQLVDTPEFPAEFKLEAELFKEILAWLKQQKDVNWTMISPPPVYFNGSPFTQRKEQYRIAKDEVLMLDGEPTGISNFDLAIAIVDELEQPKFSQQRFTAGY